MIILNYQSIHNIRDLGNYETIDQRKIKPNNFIRSASLANASNLDLEDLINNHRLSHIIDLRTSREIFEKPNHTIGNIESENIKIFKEAVKGITHDTISRELGNVEDNKDFKYCYRYFVNNDFALNGFKQAVRKIVFKHENEAYLWNCSEGKDRTGVVSMLILAILGCSKETIYQDYLETNTTNLSKAIKAKQHYLQETGNETLANTWYSIFIASPDYLDIVFEYIEANYGNIDNFIREFLEISDEEREEIKNKYLQ